MRETPEGRAMDRKRMMECLLQDQERANDEGGEGVY
jgi:hypothetical protein